MPPLVSEFQPYAGDGPPTNKQTPWRESASELYRPSDRRLSEKLVPVFLRIEGCRVVSTADPYGRILGFSLK
jgi:hypothetical protein